MTQYLHWSETILFLLFAGVGLDSCALLCDQKKAAFFGATSEFSFPSELGNPFTIVVEKEAEELRIPPTKLTHDRCFLDILFPLLRKSLIGNLRSVFLHDANHITVRLKRDKRCKISE